MCVFGVCAFGWCPSQAHLHISRKPHTLCNLLDALATPPTASAKANLPAGGPSKRTGLAYFVVALSTFQQRLGNGRKLRSTAERTIHTLPLDAARLGRHGRSEREIERDFHLRLLVSHHHPKTCGKKSTAHAHTTQHRFRVQALGAQAPY